MGKDISYQLVEFFESKITQHRKVISCERIDGEEDEYRIYKVRRTGLPNLVVLMADEYEFKETDLNGLPAQLSKGDIVYIADPNGRASSAAFSQAKERGIYIGRFGVVFGALNLAQPWTYIPLDERNKKKSS
jgi:hypothetical protein